MALNVFSRFRRLLPDSPLIIVTVDAVNSDGTSTVSTAGGGAMRVMGTDVAAGSKAYVIRGRIQSEAPDLPHFEVSV